MKKRQIKIITLFMAVVLAVGMFCIPVYAAGDVAGAIEDTWDTAS